MARLLHQRDQHRVGAAKIGHVLLEHLHVRVLERNRLVEAGIGLDLHHLPGKQHGRSEEHTSELQSLMRLSYAVFCLTNKRDNYTCPCVSLLYYCEAYELLASKESVCLVG